MKRIKSLPKDHIFVFGSNEAGRHGRGAALDALRYFGAKWNVGNGIQGQAYGIPTKDKDLNVLKLSHIHVYVDMFIEYALEHPELTFIVTPIGTGLAKLDAKDIAPMFNDVPSNVILPDEFKNLC